MTDSEHSIPANWLKRWCSVEDSQHYLGHKRRGFDTHIAPLLAGKGIQVGVKVLFERADLDAAWEAYKEAAKGSLSAPAGGKHATTRTRPTNTQQRNSMPAHQDETFEELVARVCRRSRSADDSAGGTHA